MLSTLSWKKQQLSAHCKSVMGWGADEIKHTVLDFKLWEISVHTDRAWPFLSSFRRNFQNLGCDDRTNDSSIGGASCICFI